MACVEVDHLNAVAVLTAEEVTAVRRPQNIKELASMSLVVAGTATFWIGVSSQ